MKYIYINGLGQNQKSWDAAISCIGSSADMVPVDLCSLLEGAEVSYDNLYSSLSEFCSKVHEPLILCGLSLGGVLALNYAADHPQKVQKLVLIAAQYKMPETLLRLQNIIFRFMPKSIFENTGFQKKDIIKLTNSMYKLDFTNKLQDIKTSTCVICGEKDRANITASKELFEKISRSELHILEGSKHEVNIDNPQKLAFILKTFYSESIQI